jgi:ABC-type Na+ efflux pump permease subunit
MAFVYALWVAVFTISQMLLTNTVEEKSNRIIEVLLSSVSPIELMAGKITGIAQTGLAIILAWVVSFLVIIRVVPPLLGAPATIDFTVVTRDPVYLTSFVAYFVLGYLFFAALLVAIGAVCNTLKEAQNLMGPITILLIVPLFAMMPITRDPNGTLAKVLSFIPPFTPFVMMNRAAGPPALWEYAATTALMLVSIMFALWAAAKVFRIGVLLTGKPPKPSEIFRWIRAPVGTVAVRRE